MNAAASGGAVRDASWRSTLPGVAVATAISLYLVRGLAAPGVPPGDDALAHALRVRLLVEELLPALRVDGWQSQLGLGHRAFLLYPPGYYGVVAGVQMLSAGALDTFAAMRAVAALAFALLPLAVAFLARSFGLGARASGLAALLSLAVASCCGGVGMPGTFGIGLHPHALAALPALVNLGAALRIVRYGRRRDVLATAVSLALVILLHPISALLLALLWLLVLPPVLLSGRADRDGCERPPVAAALVRLATAAALGIGLAGFWLVPALAHRDLRGILTGWPPESLGPRLVALATGTSFLRGVPAVALAAAGWLWLWTRVSEPSGRTLALLACPPLYLLLAEAFRILDPIGAFSMQVQHRGFGTVGVLAMLPAAALLDALASRSGRAGTALALAAATAVALHAALPLAPLARSDSPTPAFVRLADAIRAHVVPPARFATQVDPTQRATTGVRRPAFWLAHAADRDTFNFFNPESSPVRGEIVFATDGMTREPPDAVADLLSDFGVSHVAILAPDAAAELLRSPRFVPVFAEPPFLLLAVRAREGRPEAGSLLAAEAPARARATRHGAEALSIDVDAARETHATVAVAWSPGWHASVNGAPVTTWRSRDGLVSLRLPAGASRVDLAWRADGYDALGAALSAASAALAIAISWASASPAAPGAGRLRSPAAAG